jgi:hypothetical protein
MHVGTTYTYMCTRGIVCHQIMIISTKKYSLGIVCLAIKLCNRIFCYIWNSICFCVFVWYFEWMKFDTFQAGTCYPICKITHTGTCMGKILCPWADTGNSTSRFFYEYEYWMILPDGYIPLLSLSPQELAKNLFEDNLAYVIGHMVWNQV